MRSPPTSDCRSPSVLRSRIIRCPSNSPSAKSFPVSASSHRSPIRRSAGRCEMFRQPRRRPMKKQRFRRVILLGGSVLALGASGCSTLGGSAAEVGLAGAGGAIGYEASDHRIGGAAAGAAAGYIAAKFARQEVKRGEDDAEKRGYDRAMNQAVKQQYWIIQNQQRGAKTETPTRTLLPVVIPESNSDGVIRTASVAYVPTGS